MPTSTDRKPPSEGDPSEGLGEANQGNGSVNLELASAESPTTALGSRLPYMKVDLRFWLAILFGLLWVGFSAWVAIPWIESLGESITLPVAIFVIGGIALLPGYLNAFLLASLFLDRPRSLVPVASDESRLEWPEVTLLIATFNEESVISETLRYALESDYPGRLSIVVADDGSSDRTREEVGRAAEELAPDGRSVTLLSFPHRGKAPSLNRALARVDTEYLATIDADTLLTPEALRRAIGRLLNSTEQTAAVAGAVMARNSRRNWLTRLQEWDYQLGIAAIKRSQAIWQATLVAQGSFSVFRTPRVKEVGGWPDTIAEDIVMTWALNDGNFFLEAQPVLNLGSGEVVAYEALLRMNDPDEGVVYPPTFLYTAERFGLSAEIDDWVVGTVIGQLAETPNQASRVSLNLSAASLDISSDLPERIPVMLEVAGVDPGRLELEVTEGACVIDIERTRTFVRRMRKAGVRVTLDDFGGGMGASTTSNTCTWMC